MARKVKMNPIKATIVSAQLEGLKTRSGGSGLSEVADIVDICLDTIEKISEYHEGKISQFAGRNFLIIFSERNNEKENADAAFDALLELQRKLEELSEELKTQYPIEISAGICSGSIIMGGLESSKKRETLLGEAVETAVTIRQVTNTGQLLSNANSFSLGKENYHFEKLEPIPVKGMEDPLPLFKLISKKETKPNITSDPGRLIQSSMIGRDKEKDTLLSSLINLTKGEGGIFNIIGLPGTGKSRLITELRKEKIVVKIRWAQGKGLSHGQNLSYHPFAGIIKTWSGIKENDSNIIAEKKLKEEIDKVYPEGKDDIFPFIARILGFSLSSEEGARINEIEPDVLDKLMLKAVRELFVKLSAFKPIVIAIEDVHWVDRSSLGMLRSLFEISHHNPILFINIMRPGFAETSDLLIKYLNENHLDYLKTLEINNLNPEYSKDLIDNLLLNEQLPKNFQKEVIAKTGGNPFFIEEVLRSLIDRGAITFADKSFSFSGNISLVNIPETISEVVLSRVENLDEKTRNLLDTASVIGRDFYFKVLDQAADTIGEVSERLQYLKNMQFIQDSGEEDNLEFVFKHALAHQTAYDSMMDKKRKDLHIKIAESIEKVFPERINEFYGTLAMHYSKAENYSKAEGYLVQAGNEALRSAASAEAIDFFKEAFKIYLKNSGDEPDPTRVTELHEKIANACQLGGKNKEAIEYYEKVLNHYGMSPPSSGIKRKVALLSNMITLLIVVNFPGVRFKKEANDLNRRLSKILFFYAKALYSYDSKRWFKQSLYMFKYNSRFSFSSNANGQALFSAYSILFNWTGISLSIADRLLKISGKDLEKTSPAIQFEHGTYSKMHQFIQGDWIDDDRIENLFNSAMKRGDVFNLTPFLLYCGLITIELGMEKETNQIIDKLKIAADEFDSDHTRAQHYRLKEVAQFKFRRSNPTDQRSIKGVEFIKKTGHLAMLQVVYSMRSMSAALMDDLESARSDLQEAEKLMQPRKRIKIWYSTYLLAKAYVLTEDFRRNPDNQEIRRELLKTCKTTVRQSRVVPNNLIESHRIMANALWMTGQKKKAIRHYIKSIREAERVNGRLELSRTYFELGKRLLSNGSIRKVNGLSGKEYIGKARVLFTEIGLAYDLQELERFENK